MKKTIIPIIALVAALLIALYTIPKVHETTTLLSEDNFRVMLLYHPQHLQKDPHILAAYESVLQEEGVPYQNVDVFKLLEISPSKIKNVPVIILPDGLLQYVPEQVSEWVKDYLTRGGNIAVIYDAGIHHQKGHFLKRATFADVVGLNYITFDKLGEAVFTHGSIQFTSEASRDYFQIPFGKTCERTTFSGYGYGPLQYPIAINQPERDIPAQDIHAYGITTDKRKVPLIVLTDYAQGKVLYVNLPLGHLKANADDLPLRSVLRTFLFAQLHIPHLMNVPYGRGGIVINWHVDNSTEHTNLPVVMKQGFLRKDITASFHITAGDFVDIPGDNKGFEAGGKGKHLTTLLKNYGRIGSHGGWGHNWFAENIEAGVFTENEIRKYIVKNNECLERITGYKITEYAAPNGVHPQPVTTEILEELGVIAYYYTGDSGSAPNRTFYQNKMVSEKVISFPVMPFGRVASLWEMKTRQKNQESEVKEWFSSILHYAADNRTVRLFYSHPYDIENFPGPVKAFLDETEAMQRNKELAVFTMTDYAQFLLRYLQTKYTFHTQGNCLEISLENPNGLKGITMAVPKTKYYKPADSDLLIQEDEYYYYITVVSTDEKKKFITVSNR